MYNGEKFIDKEYNNFITLEFIYTLKSNKINILVFLLLLFFNTFFIIKNKNVSNSFKSINTNINEEQSLINKSKIYDPLKQPFLSIIFDYENLNLNNEKISNLILKFANNNCIDIQIVIFFNSSNKIIQHKIQKQQIINKNVETYVIKYKKWIHNIMDIINKISSKYIIILDKLFELTKDDIYKIYNITKGNVNNILKYNININEYLYLIRTKILKDIFDSDVEFINFQDIINFLKAYPLPKLNYIPISYSPDNKYTSFCYTSMLSVLDSKGIFSFIIFYLLIPKDFKEKNIKFLERLYEQYDYFNITFLTMDNRWNNAFMTSYLTIQTYYRYSLGEMISYLDKIIYLDVDTICFEDLFDFYNLNFRGKVLLGRVLKSYRIYNEEYYTINCGILLLNLKKMRKMKFEKKILRLLNGGFFNKNLTKEKSYNKFTSKRTADQALINIYFYKNIGPLPPKYNGKKIFNYTIVKEYNENLKYLYDNDFLYFSFKFPSIKHYPGLKDNLYNHEDWSYFARKSKYFHKITNNFSNIYDFSFV